ncbi:hypothetical protein Agub_g7262 [Astrephomene gubernaculifera]|uniref:Uncharacterized protein n=1 Tax=Astrephomene gubernaculifera TaxID=47775 RepID=A0AAD3DPS0_9CHLO|nr:hypothetical protein Agub_g7262 [Astrephomene gubernaculifera]
MAEVIHHSRNRAPPGVQGPMLHAPTAQHPGLPPAPAAPAVPWVPAAGSQPLPSPLGAEAGLRHKQVESFVGAAAAAAAAAAGGADDDVGRARRRRTPSGIAAPYQKAAAQRAAERALRPWDPAAGLGERLGAQIQANNGHSSAAAAAAAYSHPAAPSLFAPPSPAHAAAVAAAAGRVARGGQGQGQAAGAYSVLPGAPPRELWAVGAAAGPPRFCTACRGEHDESKVSDPSWQPYSPAARLTNLMLLDSGFKRAQRTGLLRCSPGSSSWAPVRWAEQPAGMSAEVFKRQLVLAFEGLREGHEPYRFLATRAAEELIDCHRPAAAAAAGGGSDPRVGTSLVAEAVPELVAPLKLCFNTLQPQLVGGALLVLRRLLLSHPSVAPALAPACPHLLPALALFRHHHTRLLLPAPACVAPTGTFAGGPDPGGAAGRSCRVCGVRLGGQRGAGKQRGRAAGAGGRHAGQYDPAAVLAAAQDPDDAAAEAEAAAASASKRLPGRSCRRYRLSELIEEVLGLLAGAGGQVGRSQVRSYVPDFGYLHHQEQPAASNNPWQQQQQRQRQEEEEEERRVAAAAQRRRQRPRSAPRPTSQPWQQQQAALAAAAPRPATAAAAAAASAAVSNVKGAAGSPPRRPSTDGGRGRSAGGEGGGHPPLPDWRSSIRLSAADLARWDGMQFRDLPYDPAAGGGGVGHVGGDVSSGGGGGAAKGGVRQPAAVGGGGNCHSAGVGPVLHVCSVVPVFDSPHDPLFRVMSAEQAAEAEAAYRGRTFVHQGRSGSGSNQGRVARGKKAGDVVRHSTGGGGGRRGYTPNVSAEVAFKDSPARLRLGFRSRLAVEGA